MLKIAVLASGSGSNFQAIIDAIDVQKIPASIAVVISDKADAYVLERAKQKSIPAQVFPYQDFPDRQKFTLAILQSLQTYQVELICLAGFMRIFTPELPTAFTGRIMNIHPALLPAFGGKGMYGHHVHEAVINSGAKFSGATVHFVTPETDVGPIIQQEIVKIEDDDTPETLAQKVHLVEHKIYPAAVKLYAEERLVIKGMRVMIKK